MTRPALTVLTTPILPAARRAYQRARGALRPIVKPGVPLPPASPYPGHYAVTRSVVEGLRAIGADFNFNPRAFADLARVVYAPANEALLQAVDLKRRGAIDYLAAGPVNALFPDENDGILLHPEIDLLIVASDWVRNLFADAPHLSAKIRTCPCGVDSDYWMPTNAPKSVALVYWKGGGRDFCGSVEDVVRRHGLEPLRIASSAGDRRRFTASSFRHSLDRSIVAVFLSPFETQGLALAEAWSMDVPTVVWNPCGDAEWRGRRFRAGSSCPYLTPETGLDWRALEQLDGVLGDVLRNRGSFGPRRWVLRHMTDAICARTLCDVIMTGARALPVAG